MDPETLQDLDARFASKWIVAAPGKGKTNILICDIIHDIQKGYSVIVMDSKGELTGIIRNLALGDRLIVLDPTTCPFAINPLDVDTGNLEAAISNVQYSLSALLETAMTPMQQSFFYNIINALFHFPNPTLKTIEDLLMRGPAPHQKLIQTMPDDVQNFFFYRWDSYDRTQKEIYWRLDLLLKRRAISEMFTAPKTRFDIGKAMDEGKVVVIDNAQSKCGVEGCGFLGRFFVSRIWAAGTAREGKAIKHPTFVYIDECFAAGTAVLTPSGYKPIETIKAGDLVITAIGTQPVRQTMHRQTDYICHVHLSNGAEIEVTPTHQFFTQHGWAPIATLSGQFLLPSVSVHAIIKAYETNQLSVLQDCIPHLSAQDTQILYSQLSSEVSLATRAHDNSPQGQFRAYALTEPYVEPSYTKKNDRHLKQDWTPAAHTRWQWTSFDPTATDIMGSPGQGLVRRAWNLCSGLSSSHTMGLQSGHRQPNIENCDRSRWKVSWSTITTDPRPKERENSEPIRVESITIQKRPGTKVFNLSVEGHPSYVVAGVVVHNCHHVIKKDQKVAAIIEELRSQRVGLILAHQKVRGQIDDLNVLSSLEICAIKMANTKAEADYFSRLFDIPPEKFDLPRGQFVTDHRDHGISIVKAPKAEIPYRQMTDQEQADLKQRMIELYGITHEGPGKSEPSREKLDLPAKEADVPIIPEPKTPTTRKKRW